jgi:hypothetical protein
MRSRKFWLTIIVLALASGGAFFIKDAAIYGCYLGFLVTIMTSYGILNNQTKKIYHEKD